MWEGLSPGPRSSPRPVFSAPSSSLLPELSWVPGAASFAPGSPLPRPQLPWGRRDGGGVEGSERRQRPWLGRSPDSRGGGERWRRKEWGTGGAGGPGALRPERAGELGRRAEVRARAPGKRCWRGARGGGPSLEPEGSGGEGTAGKDSRAWVSRAPVSRGGRGKGGGERWSPGRVGGPREAGGGWGQAFSPPLPPPRARLRPRLLLGRSRPQDEPGRSLGGNGKEAGSPPGSGSAGGAPSDPHGRLSLRCCCCCCWRRCSSALRAQAGRRPQTPLQKVHPAPATSGTLPPRSRFPGPHYYPVSSTKHPGLATQSARPHFTTPDSLSITPLYYPAPLFLSPTLIH